MSKAPRSIAPRRSALRFRTSNVFTPPRDRTPRQVSVMHPAHLPSGRESAVAFLNAEHATLDAPPLDPATENRADRTGAGTEPGRSAPARRPGEA